MKTNNFVRNTLLTMFFAGLTTLFFYATVLNDNETLLVPTALSAVLTVVFFFMKD